MLNNCESDVKTLSSDVIVHVYVTLNQKATKADDIRHVSHGFAVRRYERPADTTTFLLWSPRPYVSYHQKENVRKAKGRKGSPGLLHPTPASAHSCMERRVPFRQSVKKGVYSREREFAQRLRIGVSIDGAGPWLGLASGIRPVALPVVAAVDMPGIAWLVVDLLSWRMHSMACLHPLTACRGEVLRHSRGSLRASRQQIHRRRHRSNLLVLVH